jgi:hypothetical protein
MKNYEQDLSRLHKNLCYARDPSSGLCLQSTRDQGFALRIRRSPSSLEPRHRGERNIQFLVIGRAVSPQTARLFVSVKQPLA